MDAGDGDTLARSQLALLYRLGLLHQDAGEVENDPHAAFLNRLPPREASADDASESGSQTSGERRKHRSARSPYAPVSTYDYEPVLCIKTRTIAANGGGTATERVPLSPLSLASSSVQCPRSRFSRASSRIADITPHQRKQRWFHAWKKRVERKWALATVDAMARRHRTRDAVSTWQRAVYRKRVQVARGRQLQCWKAKRALRVWSAIASLRGRVTWFLTSQGRGFALMNRVRRERAFRRWRLFIQWSNCQQTLTTRARAFHQNSVQRKSWLQWRVYAFQVRRRRVVYRAFFVRIRGQLRERHARWEAACELYASHTDDRLRRLLRRWRLFNNARQRDHVRAWQVRMVVRRGNYFSIWYAALCHKRKIESLQFRVQRRIKRGHLQAWRTAARAIALGRCSTLWHPEAIRARYLSVWARWTRETIRFRIATARVHRSRQRRALCVVRTWTVEHARDSRSRRIADAVTRRRILLHVWENGWLAFHSKRQFDKSTARQVKLMTQARALALWRLAWAVRHEWRAKKAVARTMGLRSALQAVWGAWRRHTMKRRLHKQQLKKASRYYRQRLSMTGLVAFSSSVNRRSAHVTAARRIRVAQRFALTRRTFRGWRRHTQRMKSLQVRLDQFATNPMHIRSLWNPLRRMWVRWVIFTRIRLRLHDIKCDRHRRNTRSGFEAWKRHAFVCSQQRAHLRRLEERRRRAAFAMWRQRTCHWRSKSKRLARARLLHRRQYGLRALQAWHALVCGRRRRLRCQYEQVQDQYQLNFARRTLRRWHLQLTQRQSIQQLEARRRYAWLDVCWNGWHHYHLQQAKHKRKLRYFRQIYGSYPAMSPFRRLWNRWKSQTVLGVSASNLKRRYELRVVCACVSAWRTFRLVRLALRKWHTFSVVASATNNDQGKRIRLFRQRWRLRVARRVLFAWTRVTYSRQEQQERLAVHRRRVLREIPCAVANRRKRRRCVLRMWFQRWRRRQLVALHAAVAWHRRRLGYKVIREWWRQLVHRKQERLLQDARHTMGMMSAHKSSWTPSRGAMDTRKTVKSATRRIMKPDTAILNRSNGISTSSKRAPVTTKRMIDPDVYAATYQHRNARPLSTQGQQQRFQRPGTSSTPHNERNQRRSEAVQDPCELLEPASPMPVPHTRCAAPSEERELPLFDDDQVMHNTLQDRTEPAGKPTLVEDAHSAAEPDSDHGGDLLLSLESIASMDPYSPVKQPSRRPQHPLSAPSVRTLPQEQSVYPQRQAQGNGRPAPQEPLRSVPIPYTPRQSLRQQEASGSSSCWRSKSTAPPEKRTVVQEGLADLLEIPQHAQSQKASAFRAVLNDMRADDNEYDGGLDVDGVVKAIVDYYIVLSRRWVTSEDKHTKLWLATSGFCMLRDLGLFANEHYVAAMEQAIHRVPRDEHDLHRVMRDLLCEFIERHPHYVSPSSAEGSRSDPLGWVVSCFLTRRLGRAALSIAKDRPGRPLWIRHELPQDIVSSLPKLIKCIKKYHKPLEQFFAWRPEKKTTSRASPHRLVDHATFLLLMKHCKVYPQLFDRREVEQAMECAGSRHHHGEGIASLDIQLDFPQFVEALLRCSLRLKWIEEPSERSGEASSSSSTELVVVVKFLMLVFAMEGQGSMLTKRSQDLDVVMQFLQRQQQTDAKSAKLRRFQGLLRAESASAKTRHTKHASASVFRVAMTDCEELQSVHNDGSGRGAAVDPPMVGRRVGSQNADDEEKTSHRQPQRGPDELLQELRHRIRAKAPMDHREDTIRPADDNAAHQRTDGVCESNRTRVMYESTLGSPRLAFGPPSTAAVSEPENRVLRSYPDGIDSAGSPNVRTKHSDGGDMGDRISEGAATADTQVATAFATAQDLLLAPMDRDAFLNEILSSIQDVELLLQQSKVPRSATYPSVQDTTERDVELTSEPFSAAYPERYAVLMNGQLPSASADVSSEGSEADLPMDDIRIRDPLLDSLTFADRFSESRDWQSQLSIADLAAHGIHAAFPSALHVCSALEPGELDDLTDPQRTAAYLRAEPDDDGEDMAFDGLIRM